MLKIRDFRFKKSDPTIMGILNLTPDSFSDGNRFNTTDLALKGVEIMLQEGADIIDIGGESSRPGSKPVSLQEELDRVATVVERVISEFRCCVSVDTYKGEVAKEMLTLGASMINDIYGLTRSPEIADIVASFDASLTIMHMKGNPEDMQNNTNYSNIVDDIYKFLIDKERFALSKGVNKNSIFLDVGIGFGKSLEGNLSLINKLERYIDYNLLLGTSRKSFIGTLLNLDIDKRLSATISSNVIAYMKGCSIFRVHDVKEHREALDLAKGVLQS